MVASRQTVNEVLKTVLKYVPRAAMRKIIRELKEVKGNSSFKKTIIEMEKQLKQES